MCLRHMQSERSFIRIQHILLWAARELFLSQLNNWAPIFTRLVSESRRNSSVSASRELFGVVAEKLIDFPFLFALYSLTHIIFFCCWHYRARDSCTTDNTQHHCPSSWPDTRCRRRAPSWHCIVHAMNRPIPFASSRTSDDGVWTISRGMVKRWRSHSTTLCRHDCTRVSFVTQLKLIWAKMLRARVSQGCLKRPNFSSSIFSRVPGWQSAQRVRSDRADHQRDRAVWSSDGDDIQVRAVANRHNKIDASVAGRQTIDSCETASFN